MPFRSFRKSYLFTFVVICSTIVIIRLVTHLPDHPHECTSEAIFFRRQRQFSNVSKEKQPLIFIGGMPRSGTTLMRAILDSHPNVQCGQETRVIPAIVTMRLTWEKSTSEWNRLLAGGLSQTIIDSAVRAFVYEILIHHSKYADVLCAKDPFILRSALYLSSIFSQSKFLLLIRDGRAVVHSIIARNVTISGFSPHNYRENLKLWNRNIEVMIKQCELLGNLKCHRVYYEQLVLQPKATIEKILKFLNLNWAEQVLHHEDLIGKKIAISRIEPSSDQIVKPINLNALTEWTKTFPQEIQKELDTLAPMLKKLGYDTKSNVPVYGTPDEIVLKNMNQLKENASFWKEKVKLYARISPDENNLSKH